MAGNPNTGRGENSWPQHLRVNSQQSTLRVWPMPYAPFPKLSQIAAPVAGRHTGRGETQHGQNRAREHR